MKRCDRGELVWLRLQAPSAVDEHRAVRLSPCSTGVQSSGFSAQRDRAAADGKYHDDRENARMGLDHSRKSIVANSPARFHSIPTSGPGPSRTIVGADSSFHRQPGRCAGVATAAASADAVSAPRSWPSARCVWIAREERNYRNSGNDATRRQSSPLHTTLERNGPSERSSPLLSPLHSTLHREPRDHNRDRSLSGRIRPRQRESLRIWNIPWRNS